MRSGSFGSQGLQTMQVYIMEIVGTTAMCVDQFNRSYNVPLNVQRAKGILPAVGDTWMIDKAMGTKWTFAAICNYMPDPDDLVHNIAQDDPCFWWPLSDVAGSTAAMDNGYGTTGTLPGLNDGTVHAPVTFGSMPVPPGWYTTAATVTGGYISTSTAAYASNYTIEIWVSTTQTTAGTLLSYSTTSLLAMQATTGYPTFYSSATTQTGTNAINDGNWHQVVGVQTSTGLILYVDGAVQATSTASVSGATGSSWKIGNANFTGELGHAAYYDHVVPRHRIQAHYLAGTL